MPDLWLWLTVAGLGALHALNPATGWVFAAAWAVQSRESSLALSALLPIAAGHFTSIALVYAVMTLGLALDRVVLQYATVGLLIATAALLVLPKHAAKRVPVPVTPVALALCSFLTSTAHGAGLMLVPALIPLCMGDAPAGPITTSGSLTLVLAAVAIHTATMLAVTGAIAVGAHRAFDVAPGILRVLRQRRPAIRITARST